MYADPKRIRSNRVPVYLDSYVHQRLARIVEMTGGEKSAVSREALERGLELFERELHSAQSAPAAMEMRGAVPAFATA